MFNYLKKNMKKSTILILSFLFSLPVFSQKVEEDKIKETIQIAYVEGLNNEGNADKIDKGIHPDFQLLGIGKNGTMWKYSIQKWKESSLNDRKKGNLPPTKDKMVSVVFKSIDITGSAAMVKLEYFVGTKLTYIDYITLYKFDEDWKMVSKIYQKID